MPGPSAGCQPRLTCIICLQVPGDFSAAVEPSISTGNIVLVCGKNNTLCLFASAARPPHLLGWAWQPRGVPSPSPKLLLQVPAPVRNPAGPRLRAHLVEDVLPLPLAPRPYFCPGAVMLEAKSWAQKDVSFHRCSIVFLSSPAFSLSLIPSPSSSSFCAFSTQRGLVLRRDGCGAGGGTLAHGAGIKKKSKYRK